MGNSFQLKGNLCFVDEKKELHLFENKVLVVKDGKIEKIKDDFDFSLPYTIIDKSGRLILPGFSDLHAHASQYPFHGIGSDCELLEWLGIHAFKTEAKYQDLTFAEKAYELFTEDLRKSYTTRISLFATLHKEATLVLMKKMEEKGLAGYVGLVNMDQNCVDYLQEKDAPSALVKTEEFIKEANPFELVKPIITPRFALSCSDAELKGLGELSLKYSLPVQSHLDENPSEIAETMKIFPEYKNYTDIYYQNHLFGNPNKTIMAHCIYNNADEVKLLKDNNVYVAHCPECNLNVMSGIAPIRKYLDEGIHVGLGSDVAGGSSLDLTLQIRAAMQVSKAYSRIVDKSAKPLSLIDGFTLATLGGGSFFGKAGSFLPGYEADILVIDDHASDRLIDFSLEDRLEHFLMRPDETTLVSKFISGRRVL